MGQVEPVAANEFRDRGLLDSAVHRPHQSVFGKEAYPTLRDKAAVLFRRRLAKCGRCRTSSPWPRNIQTSEWR